MFHDRIFENFAMIGEASVESWETFHFCFFLD